MQTLQRLKIYNRLHAVRTTSFNPIGHHLKTYSTKSKSAGDDEWNNAWESAWLPEDLSAKNRAPWETDVNFSSSESAIVLPSDVDAETKAFVEDMTENWNERRKGQQMQEEKRDSLYNLENMKKDYRLKKQRLHAGLWMKEIEKQEEAKLGDLVAGGGDDIDRLLDSYSEYVSIFFCSCRSFTRLVFCLCIEIKSFIFNFIVELINHNKRILKGSPANAINVIKIETE